MQRMRLESHVNQRRIIQYLPQLMDDYIGGMHALQRIVQLQRLDHVGFQEWTLFHGVMKDRIRQGCFEPHGIYYDFSCKKGLVGCEGYLSIFFFPMACGFRDVYRPRSSISHNRWIMEFEAGFLSAYPSKNALKASSKIK